MNGISILATVFAAEPPPSLELSLQQQVIAEVHHIERSQDLPAALAYGDRFRQKVLDGIQIQYELALMVNRSGDLKAASTRYSQLLNQDPNHIASLYDRGEIHLLLGRYDAAESDLRQLEVLKPDVWVVHFRLAELAGHQSKTEVFEQQILEALRDGFSLSLLAESGQHWHNWANDPSLGLVLKQIFLLYGSEEKWLQLQQSY